MKISEQLQNQRKIHHMSQEDLATKLHISRQAISKWENGTTLPNIGNIIAISNLFDVSLDDLIKGDGELMEKFEDDKIRLNKIETIVLTSGILTAVILAIVYYFGLVKGFEYYMPLVELIALFGFLTNIDWRSANKVMNKRAVFFGIIMIGLFLALSVTNNLPDILKGMSEGVNDYK